MKKFFENPTAILAIIALLAGIVNERIEALRDEANSVEQEAQDIRMNYEQEADQVELQKMSLYALFPDTNSAYFQQKLAGLDARLQLAELNADKLEVLEHAREEKVELLQDQEVYSEYAQMLVQLALFLSALHHDRARKVRTVFASFLTAVALVLIVYCYVHIV
ncbi:MAG: hypothetical protein V4616_01775 [Bacteroidota bacterium]